MFFTHFLLISLLLLRMIFIRYVSGGIIKPFLHFILPENIRKRFSGMYKTETLARKGLKCVQKQPLNVFGKNVFLKISQNLQENTCTTVSFLIKLQASDLQLYQKRDSGTGVFLWILQNFQEHLFYRTPLVAASLCN